MHSEKALDQALEAALRDDEQFLRWFISKTKLPNPLRTHWLQRGARLLGVEYVRPFVQAR